MEARMRRLCWAAVVLATVSGGRADEPVVPAGAGRECLPPVFLPYCPPAPRPPAEPVRPVDPTRPPPTAKDSTAPPVPPPSADALARSPEAGTLSAATFNPNMFG